MSFGKSKGYCNQGTELIRANEEIVRLRSERDRYHAALEHYARHRWTCPMFNPSSADREAGVECDCCGRPAIEALGLQAHC